MIRNFSKEKINQEFKTKLASRPYTAERRELKGDKNIDKNSNKIGPYIYS